MSSTWSLETCPRKLRRWSERSTSCPALRCGERGDTRSGQQLTAQQLVTPVLLTLSRSNRNSSRTATAQRRREARATQLQELSTSCPLLTAAERQIPSKCEAKSLCRPARCSVARIAAPDDTLVSEIIEGVAYQKVDGLRCSACPLKSRGKTRCCQFPRRRQRVQDRSTTTNLLLCLLSEGGRQRRVGSNGRKVSATCTAMACSVGNGPYRMYAQVSSASAAAPHRSPTCSKPSGSSRTERPT
jgi:hypothetical protein